MTREDTLKMMEMRMDGYTLQEVADYYGVTRQCVSQILHRVLSENKNAVRCKCIYPGLANWMLAQGVTAYKMSNELAQFNSVTSFYNRLIGKTEFTLSEIKALLKYTNSTFEELFGGESE